MAVPNIFANVTTSIPLSQLDTNFATAITLGNTAVYLGNTTTTLGNLTLTNVTLSSGTSNLASTSISNGTSNVSIASSGGNITMASNGTTAVTIDTSQNMGIGTSSVGTFYGKTVEISNTNDCALKFTNTQTGFTSSDGTYVGLLNSANTDFYLNNRESGAMIFQTANTERMRINAGAPILCLSGGSTTATGTGIAFPATQSASSNANTLDDYEEGDWTPTISSGYTSVSYNSQGGWYTKVGRFVNISGRVQFSGTANNTNIQIGSLPFSQANVGNGAYGGGGIPYCTVAAIVGTSPYVGSSTVDFYTTGTGTQITSGATNVTNGWISFVITIASAT